jgi:hypothetical protein
MFFLVDNNYWVLYLIKKNDEVGSDSRFHGGVLIVATTKGVKP